jgi:hypothetical protein
VFVFTFSRKFPLRQALIHRDFASFDAMPLMNTYTHADGSMIQLRASPTLTNADLGVVRLSGNNSSAADQNHAPIHQEPKASPSLYSDAMFAAVTPRLESSSSAKYSGVKTMSPLDPYMVESDDEFDSAFVHAASSAMLSSRSLVWSSGGSNLEDLCHYQDPVPFLEPNKQVVPM